MRDTSYYAIGSGYGKDFLVLLGSTFRPEVVIHGWRLMSGLPNSDEILKFDTSELAEKWLRDNRHAAIVGSIEVGDDAYVVEIKEKIEIEMVAKPVPRKPGSAFRASDLIKALEWFIQHHGNYKVWFVEGNRSVSLNRVSAVAEFIDAKETCFLSHVRPQIP